MASGGTAQGAWSCSKDLATLPVEADSFVNIWQNSSRCALRSFAACNAAIDFSASCRIETNSWQTLGICGCCRGGAPKNCAAASVATATTKTDANANVRGYS